MKKRNIIILIIFLYFTVGQLIGAALAAWAIHRLSELGFNLPF